MVTETLTRGTWQVEVRDTQFGPLLLHGIETDGLFAFAWLHPIAGWRLDTHPCLSHQTYVQKVAHIIQVVPDVREIAVINLWTGEWASVYLRNGMDSVTTRRGKFTLSAGRSDDDHAGAGRAGGTEWGHE